MNRTIVAPPRRSTSHAGIQACGSTKDEVAKMMEKVGFSKKMMTDPVTTLSGGWRMKFALSRAMLQNADILTDGRADEPPYRM